MPHFKNSHQVLRLVRIYRRVFSVLTANVGIENIVKVNVDAEVVVWKIPGILVLLFTTAVTIFTLILQIYCQNTLPYSENLTLSFTVLSYYFTFAFPLISSMFNYRKIYLFWSKLYETTCFALSELGYDISFEYFWKCFWKDAVISSMTFIVCGSFRLYFYSPRTAYERQICAAFLYEIIVYIVIHALFIINLNSFFHRLLIKYINLDYRNRASNLMFDHVECSLLQQLRVYKQFHYKLWEMTSAVNAFFGSTLMVLCCHAFIDVAHSAYYLFLYISARGATDTLISKSYVSRRDPKSSRVIDVIYYCMHYCLD